MFPWRCVMDMSRAILFGVVHTARMNER